MNDHLHYRGHTLVNDRGYRWASEDGSPKRRLVCREHIPQEKAVRLFRERVDKELDAR